MKTCVERKVLIICEDVNEKVMILFLRWSSGWNFFSLCGFLRIQVITKPGLSSLNVLRCVESERIPLDVVGPMRFFWWDIPTGQRREWTVSLPLFVCIVGRCCLVVGSTRFRQLGCRCLRFTLIACQFLFPSCTYGTMSVGTWWSAPGMIWCATWCGSQISQQGR